MIVHKINFFFKTSLELSLVNILKSIGHDTNEHIHANYNKQETTNNKEDPAHISSKWSITHSFYIEFSQHHDPHLQERI